MTELVVKVPDDMEEEFSEDWSEVALEAIKARVFELELNRSKSIRRALLELLASKSKLTEKDALELGRLIKKGRYEKLKTQGLV